MTNITVRKEIRESVEFFTVNKTGESGMSESGLARLVDTPRKTVSDLLQDLAGGNPRSESLKHLSGKDLWLAERGEDNAKIVKDAVCASVIEYYAFDARKTTDAARFAYRKFAQEGIRSWIQGITGWVKTENTGQPYWYRRMMLYREKTKIPVGYFSIFEEIISLIGDLEAQGYIIPTGCIPDISVGKCWANHLQKVEKISAKNVGKKYKHYYPDWAYPIEAFIYPLELLPKFRIWMEEMYKPLKMMEYFRKKDPSALPSVCKLLGLPEGK